MHILLTDVVTCPRCGPEFGLIVLADRMEERQVVEGSLGCANCREEYPVRRGIADLRWTGSGAAGEARQSGAAPSAAGETDPERAYRMAALLGVTGPAGPVVLVSVEPGTVAEVQGHLPDAGVVGLSPEQPAAAEGAGLGWVLTRGPLPFRSRSLGGVVLASGNPAPLVEEALRCLGRGARLVIDPAPPGTVAKVLEEGGELLLEQEAVAVAFDPRAG